MRKLLITILLLVGSALGQTVIGTQTLLTNVDTLSQGHVKAYSVKILVAAPTVTYCWYLDTGTTATKVQFGLYGGTSAPTVLVASQTVNVTGVPGWVCQPFPFAASTVGWIYWESILGVNGIVKVRVSPTAGQSSVNGSILTTMPANWTGTAGTTGMPSAYASAGTPPPPVAITVSPTTYPLPVCAASAITATVTGATDKSVTYKVSGTITATSNADPTKSATVTLTDCVTTSHSILLQWVNPTQTNGAIVTGVNLYKSTNNGPYAVFNTLTPTAVAVVDSNVVSGSSYSYKVTEVATASKPQESAFSNIVTLTLP